MYYRKSAGEDDCANWQQVAIKNLTPDNLIRGIDGKPEVFLSCVLIFCLMTA